MTAISVTFDGYNLASSVTGLRVVRTDPFRAPDREANSFPIANANKSKTSAAYFRKKKINVSVEIGRNDRDLFEASLDQLYTILQTREATLQFNYANSYRKWTATLSNISIDDPQGGLGNVELEFTCSDPMGYDTSSTTIINSSRTGRTSTDNFVLGGTFKYQAPVITITLTNVTGGTNKTVSIGNPATGQQVDITRNWATNDVIVIDCVADSVKVNGSDVDFDGGIPKWAPGAGSMSYTDNLTTATHQHSGIHYRRYL